MIESSLIWRELPTTLARTWLALYPIFAKSLSAQSSQENSKACSSFVFASPFPCQISAKPKAHLLHFLIHLSPTRYQSFTPGIQCSIVIHCLASVALGLNIPLSD